MRTARLTPRQAAMLEVMDMVEAKPDVGGTMPKGDKFVTIALMCGPPTDAFRWDVRKADDFRELAAELFGLREQRHILGLYTLYEKWYAGEDLDRMLTERQAAKEALGSG